MKIAIDTNILLRLILKDDHKLYKQADKLVSRYTDDEIYVTYAVCIETFFVLKMLYQWPQAQICDILEDALNSRELVFENEMALRLALNKARKKRPFVDSLIGELGGMKNVKTCTFDQRLKNDSKFVVLD